MALAHAYSIESDPRPAPRGSRERRAGAVRDRSRETVEGLPGVGSLQPLQWA